MFWFMQAMERCGLWLDALLTCPEHPFLVTLESEKGWRWQVEVLAENLASARALVTDEFPRERILDVEPLDT